MEGGGGGQDEEEDEEKEEEAISGEGGCRVNRLRRAVWFVPVCRRMRCDVYLLFSCLHPQNTHTLGLGSGC